MDKWKESQLVVCDDATIDWTIKKNVRVKLKSEDEKTALRKFGCPPDAQKLARETILKQKELSPKNMTSQDG